METNQLTKLLEEFKSDLISAIRAELSKITVEPSSRRIPSVQFCKDQNISRHALYKWREKGIVQTEKIGGKLYVIPDTLIRKKYERTAAIA